MTVINDDDLIRRSSRYYRDGGLNIEQWARIASWPDYDRVIADYDWTGALLAHRGKDAIAILDCGCGVGHFPRQLQSKVTFPPGVTLNYDTLDVSSYSLTEHRNNLRPPFNPRNSFNCAMEDFRPAPWAGHYEVIWLMHSMYTVSRVRLPGVLATLTSLLATDGRCFIYLPKKKSAYMVLWDLYLSELGPGAGQPYLAADDVLEALTARRARSVETVDCRLDHWIEAGEPHALAAYLNQACLCPVPLTLAEWRQPAAFCEYLDAAFDRERSAWRFRQELSLITFAGDGGRRPSCPAIPRRLRVRVPQLPSLLAISDGGVPCVW
jgi:SAM-dependent methyltransferase